MSPSSGQPARAAKGSAPIEYSLLQTATLCLLALGVVMVFSASSTTSLLGEAGDGAYFLKRTVIFGAIGLVAMRVLSARGLGGVWAMTPMLLAISFGLLLATLVPGIGVEANGARRWIAAGPVQIQASEVAKLALILYGARLLAERPRIVGDLRSMLPYLLLSATACLLILAEPDLGSAVVVALAIATLLVAGGARIRSLAMLAAALAVLAVIAIAIAPYRQDRVAGFLSPGADPEGAGFQGIQATIALGSGGIFGVGLGESVQKAFYLPEAHTDMIAAVIGEELGLVGITALLGLYVLLAYAGFRTAQRARDRYGKLLAAGLTGMISVQAVVNVFAVLGLAPLTGVPLPFVSYGNSSLIVMLSAIGLLLNVARGGTAASAARSSGRKAASSRGRPVRSSRRGRARAAPRPAAAAGARLRAIPPSGGGRSQRRTATGAKGRDRSRRDRRARGSGPRRRRRAAG